MDVTNDSHGSKATLELLSDAIKKHTASMSPQRSQLTELAVSDVVWFPYHKNDEFKRIVGLIN